MHAWPFTLVIIHALAAYLFAVLYTRAPDVGAKAVMGVFMVVMLLMIAGYAFAIDPADTVGPYVRWVAQELEHLAVLFLGLRLLWREKLSCKNLQHQSPLSLGL